MEKRTRKTPEEILKGAQIYFDKLGLTPVLDVYFEKQFVKDEVHQIYAKYEENIQNLVEHMPTVLKKRSEEVIGEAIGREDAFFSDVKSNMMCNITRLIMALEDFMPVDERITQL